VKQSAQLRSDRLLLAA